MPTASPATPSADNPSSPEPVPAPKKSRRLPALDVLRGIAILGTLLTNIWIFSGIDGVLAVAGQSTDSDGADAAEGTTSLLASANEVILQCLNLVTDGKFIGLLTIMFGVGLEIQRQSAIRKGEKWPGRYPWRAGLLVLDGLLNYIFIFQYDVLMGYGLTGLVVAVIMATSPKAQKVWMYIGVTAHLAVMIGWTILSSMTDSEFEDSGTPPTPSEAVDSEEIRPEDSLAGSGAYWAGVAARLSQFWLGRSEIPIMFTMGLGLFLVGAHLYRSGLFLPEGHRLRVWVMGLSFGIGLPIDWTLRLLGGETFWLLTRYVTSALVSFGILALVAHFYVGRSGAGRAGRLLSLVGRMALTCYVLQNLVASIIFFDWGFGLASVIDGDWSVLATLAVFVGIAAGLIAFSWLWLKRFDRGPIELVWHRSYEAVCAGLDRRAARRAERQATTSA